MVLWQNERSNGMCFKLYSYLNFLRPTTTHTGAANLSNRPFYSKKNNQLSKYLYNVAEYLNA